MKKQNMKKETRKPKRSRKSFQDQMVDEVNEHYKHVKLGVEIMLKAVDERRCNRDEDGVLFAALSVSAVCMDPDKLRDATAVLLIMLHDARQELKKSVSRN